jgi:hypothetical protein
MIECIFTLDYEIYGNGTGSLTDLVYEPTEQLRAIFDKWSAKFVTFVEVAEYEKIEAYGTDPVIGAVKKQVRDLHRQGFEIGLHLHPQWCNAQYQDGRWFLDFAEYNLCTLSRARIAEIVERSLAYLRHVVNTPNFTPLSFRAGNWLFQPTQPAASSLSNKGIKIDSSVFKGGLQHGPNLDYRPALKNGYYWSFHRDVSEPDPAGPWLEVPIYTEMVPVWRMPTSKRLGLGNNLGFSGKRVEKKWSRLGDFLRFRYPRKFDFCRMNLGEMASMIRRVIRQDREQPALYRPLVAIGHTKDLTEPQVVDDFLCFLRANGIGITTFASIYPKLTAGVGRQQDLSAAPYSKGMECHRPLENPHVRRA